MKDKAVGPINRVQRIGAQAIVRTFLTVATSVAEAEAHIATAQDRFWRRAIKLWAEIHSLPKTNPLRSNTYSIRKFRKLHRSPLYQVADALKGIEMEGMETINPFALAPWEKRVDTIIDETAAARQVDINWAIRIAVSSSARNSVVGIGGVIQTQTSLGDSPRLETFSSTLGKRSEQNAYSGTLAAIARSLSILPAVRCRSIALLTNNKAAVLTLRKPQQQSGQEHVCHIYKSIRKLRKKGTLVTIIWLPTSEENELLKLAKDKAKSATRQGATPQTQLSRMKSTTLNIARAKRSTSRLPEDVGKHSKRVDTALPGKHTRQLYDRLSWKEASVLAQLRTGMAKINTYLYRIKAASTDQCACGQAKETVEHFLFRCRGGWHIEQRCCNAQIPTEATHLSTSEGNHHRTTKTGLRT